MPSVKSISPAGPIRTFNADEDALKRGFAVPSPNPGEVAVYGGKQISPAQQGLQFAPPNETVRPLAKTTSFAPPPPSFAASTRQKGPADFNLQTMAPPGRPSPPASPGGGISPFAHVLTSGVNPNVSAASMLAMKQQRLTQIRKRLDVREQAEQKAIAKAHEAGIPLTPHDLYRIRQRAILWAQIRKGVPMGTHVDRLVQSNTRPQPGPQNGNDDQTQYVSG